MNGLILEEQGAECQLNLLERMKTSCSANYQRTQQTPNVKNLKANSNSCNSPFKTQFPYDQPLLFLSKRYWYWCHSLGLERLAIIPSTSFIIIIKMTSDIWITLHLHSMLQQWGTALRAIIGLIYKVEGPVWTAVQYGGIVYARAPV